MINKQRLIKTTQSVIRIPSVNPGGNEVAIADYIVRDMKSLNLDVKVVSYEKNRPNVIVTLKGSLPRKQAKANSILVTPHIDTVPTGDGWKYDPFSGKIVGNKIFGRGTSDDKGNLAVCMEVMRSLVEDGWVPKKDIVLAATADEETGSHAGILPLLAKGVLKPKVALITDSEDFNTIVSQKGLLHIRIQILGRKAHGAYNWLGNNAIETAAKVIERLKKHQFKVKRNKFHKPPTKNIGTIIGGDKCNMVADFCEFSLDTRFLPGMKGKDVLKEIKSIISQETKNFKIIVDDMQAPYEIDPKHPFVSTFVQTCSNMKYKANLKGSEGATVITFFQNYKIPAFSTGWGASGTMHSTDEYCEISTIVKGAKVLEQFLKDWDDVDY